MPTKRTKTKKPKKRKEYEVKRIPNLPHDPETFAEAMFDLADIKAFGAGQVPLRAPELWEKDADKSGE